MTKTETYCTECGTASREQTAHCPECGAEDPWDERPAYQFDEDDLPYIFDVGHGAKWDLWRAFCDAYWGSPELKGSEVVKPEEFPRLKYGYVTVYWVITESYDLEGPFLSKSDAREAVRNE